MLEVFKTGSAFEVVVRGYPVKMYFTAAYNPLPLQAAKKILISTNAAPESLSTMTR